jgi:hypothetical protein
LVVVLSGRRGRAIARGELNPTTYRLTRADQIAFAKTLIDPPAPNKHLMRSAKRHAALIQRERKLP